MQRQHELLNEVASLIETGILKSTVTEVMTPINAANLRAAHAKNRDWTHDRQNRFRRLELAQTPTIAQIPLDLRLQVLPALYFIQSRRKIAVIDSCTPRVAGHENRPLLNLHNQVRSVTGNKRRLTRTIALVSLPELDRSAFDRIIKHTNTSRLIPQPTDQIWFQIANTDSWFYVRLFFWFRSFEGSVSLAPSELPLSIRFRTLMSFPSALRHVARWAQNTA